MQSDAELFDIGGPRTPPAADHLSVEVGGYGVKNGSFSYKSLKTGRRWKEVLP